MGRMNDSGKIAVGGKQVSYVIRRLPVNSFPDLPPAFAAELNRRGCMIPQSYGAHGPENVVHARLERAGADDWAVLCSAEGTVRLLVSFSSDPGKVAELAAAPETERLQVHDLTGVLGFDWAIQIATPSRIHDAQAGMEHRPPMVDHDAIAEGVIDRRTVYHFFNQSAWTTLDVPD